MKLNRIVPLALLAAMGLIASPGYSADNGFDSGLASIEAEWAAAKYETSDKHARDAAFQALIEHAATFAQAYPDRAEAVAWEGIVLSTYAGEVSALSAMKYAKAARDALLRAERLDATALDGGIYASLGTLYFKVPGGLLGFGDDDQAKDYFEKALAADASNIDTNYFYAQFMLDQGDAATAVTALNRALATPADPNRPVFEAGRREEIRTLLAEATRKAG
jgi:tetratricopeptide (TPR) repeat protein